VDWTPGEPWFDSCQGQEIYLSNAQAGSGSGPGCCSMGIGELEDARAEARRWPRPCCIEVKNKCRCTFALSVCILDVHSDSFGLPWGAGGERFI
jgi:hypothetical protein